MRKITAAALLLVAGCTEADKMREANIEADRIECAAKGGVQYRGDCVKIDSIIPMTGPRANPTPYKP